MNKNKVTVDELMKVYNKKDGNVSTYKVGLSVDRNYKTSINELMFSANKLQKITQKIASVKTFELAQKINPSELFGLIVDKKETATNLLYTACLLWVLIHKEYKLNKTDLQFKNLFSHGKVRWINYTKKDGTINPDKKKTVFKLSHFIQACSLAKADKTAKAKTTKRTPKKETAKKETAKAA